MGVKSYDEAVKLIKEAAKKGEYYMIRQEHDTLEFYGEPCNKSECEEQLKSSLKKKHKLKVIKGGKS